VLAGRGRPRSNFSTPAKACPVAVQPLQEICGFIWEFTMIAFFLGSVIATMTDAKPRLKPPSL
jgi:hypothetical protein